MGKELTFDVFRRLIFGDLRPWMNREITNTKFKQSMKDLKEIEFNHNPLFALQFHRPLNDMRKYYCRVIQNETIQFLNGFNSIMQVITQNEQKFQVYKIVNQNLPPLLKDLDALIKEKGFSYDVIKPENVHLQSNATFANETFVFQFLKYNLIYIFLEIQKKYPALLKQEVLELEEIHQVHFNEYPEVNFIIANEILVYDAPKMDNLKGIEGTEEKFTPELRDFRVDKPKILKYEAVIKKPNLFAQFEEQLYANNIIDLKTTFIPKSIEINELAKIYHILIKKGYFNKRKFAPNREITITEIRKFLDYRYDVDTDQQFRKFKNNPDSVSEYQAKKYWLDNLTVCS